MIPKIHINHKTAVKGHTNIHWVRPNSDEKIMKC